MKFCEGDIVGASRLEAGPYLAPLGDGDICAPRCAEGLDRCVPVWVLADDDPRPLRSPDRRPKQLELRRARAYGTSRRTA